MQVFPKKFLCPLVCAVDTSHVSQCLMTCYHGSNKGQRTSLALFVHVSLQTYLHGPSRHSSLGPAHLSTRLLHTLHYPPVHPAAQATHIPTTDSHIASVQNRVLRNSCTELPWLYCTTVSQQNAGANRHNYLLLVGILN